MNMRWEYYLVVNGIPNSGRGETAQPTPDPSYVTPHSHLEITTMKDIGPRKKREQNRYSKAIPWHIKKNPANTLNPLPQNPNRWRGSITNKQNQRKKTRNKIAYLAEEEYFVTALVPSDTACLASSPGKMSRTLRLMSVKFRLGMKSTLTMSGSLATRLSTSCCRQQVSKLQLRHARRCLRIVRTIFISHHFSV